MEKVHQVRRIGKFSEDFVILNQNCVKFRYVFHAIYGSGQKYACYTKMSGSHAIIGSQT